MNLVRFDQLLVLGLFMAVLGALWLLVQRHKSGITAKLHRGKRLHVAESLSLGGHARATLLSVDGRDYLLVHGKAGASVLHAVEPAPAGPGGQP